MREWIETDLGVASWLFEGVAYTLLLVTFTLIIQWAYRKLASHIDDWKPAEEGVKIRSAVLLSPERVRGMLTGALRVIRALLIFALLYLYVPASASAVWRGLPGFFVWAEI
jgi:hypothetical protein